MMRIIIAGAHDWPATVQGWEALIGAICNHLPPGGIMDPGTPPTPSAGTLAFTTGTSGVQAMMRDWGLGRDGDMIRMTAEPHRTPESLIGSTGIVKTDLILTFPHSGHSHETSLAFAAASMFGIPLRTTTLLSRGQWKTRALTDHTHDHLRALNWA